MRRDGSSQGGSLIIAADRRILDGFEANVEMLGMLEFTKVFYTQFLDPWKSLSDVESIFLRNNTKSPVITDAKSLYDALERSESSTRNLAERRTAKEFTAIDKGWNMDSSFLVG